MADDVFEPIRDEDSPDDLDDLAVGNERHTLMHIRTHVPATVLAYNPDKYSVRVRVDALQTIRVLDGVFPEQSKIERTDGEFVTLKAFEIDDVPLDGMRTATAWIHLPISAGDTGMLHVSDRSIARWREKGEAVDPIIALTHALEDSVFRPGVVPDGKVLNPPPDNTMATAHCDAGWKLDRDAVDALTLYPALATWVGDVATWAAGLVASLVDGKVTSGAGAFPSLPSSVATTKVKAK